MGKRRDKVHSFSPEIETILPKKQQFRNQSEAWKVSREYWDSDLIFMHVLLLGASTI